MKVKLIKGFGLLFTVAAIAYFVIIAVHNAASLPSLEWGRWAYLLAAVCITLYVCIVAVGGSAWFLLLRGMKQRVPFKMALTIFAMANIAKYIPGNVGQLVGRVALARRRGFDSTAVISSLVFEAAWDILSASVFAILILAIAGNTYLNAARQLPNIWQLSVAAALAACLPFVCLWMIRHCRFGPLKVLEKVGSLVSPDGGALFGCFCLYVVTFLIMGLIAQLLAERLFGASSADFWVVSGAVTIAWVAGFVTPGSPAGAGVREAILTAILSPIYTPGVAIGVSIALRVVTSVGDGVAFIIAGAGNQLMSRWNARSVDV